MRRLLFLASLVIAVPSPAAACHNEIQIVLDPGVAAARRAERSIRSGHLRRAYRQAARATRGGRLEPHVRQRINLIMAVVVVRLRGSIERSSTGQLHGRTRELANLAWAVGHLRTLHELRPTDVVRTARLAEALAQIPGGNEEAFSLLSPLENVLPDVQAYATLATVLGARGDADGRDRVLAGCRARASYAERGVCRVQPADNT